MVKKKVESLSTTTLRGNHFFLFPKARIPVYCSNTHLANFLAENSKVANIYYIS